MDQHQAFSMLFYNKIECNACGFTIHSFYYVYSSCHSTAGSIQNFFVGLNKMYSSGVKIFKKWDKIVIKSRIKLLLGAICKNWSPGISYM